MVSEKLYCAQLCLQKWEWRGTDVNKCRGADKSLARPTSRFILLDGENISFDANLVIYRVSQNYVNTTGLWYHLFPAKCVSGL